jgi:general secretion pathway protein E
MTGHQSLQFVEYLRQAGHLKAADAVGVTDTGAPDQLQGNIRRTLQSAALGKLWEATDLSASEFADEVARFYGYSRVALQDMLSATPLVAAFSQRFLAALVFPEQPITDRAVIADPTDRGPVAGNRAWAEHRNQGGLV